MAALLAEANRRADAAASLADRLVAQLREAHAPADQAEGRARAAQEQTEALERAEADRQARGRWARLRAAWRGCRVGEPELSDPLRRNLTKGQQAAALAMIYPEPERGRGKTDDAKKGAEAAS